MWTRFTKKRVEGLDRRSLRYGTVKCLWEILYVMIEDYGYTVKIKLKIGR